jgi:predicted nucleotidyltransferase
MDREKIIEILREHRSTLERRGVHHAALFGSVARAEQREDSDIDILVDLGPDTPLTVYDLVSLQDFVGGLFDRKVDVVTSAGLRSYARGSVARDAIYAF